MSGIRRLATMASSRMKSWFPTTSAPLVVSAPMDFVTNAKLASEVTKAGGFGFIQGGRDFSSGCAALKKLDEELVFARKTLGLEQDTNSILPVGVGFVTYPPSVKEFGTTTAPILQRHRPAAVWLFAPSPSAHTTLPDMIKSLRPVGDVWGLKVVVQVGTVSAARKAVLDGADIIVAQGTDAGGHQFAAGASIISLVPEISDVLTGEFPDRHIGLWAAGGIADGRGVAAALALGADAVVVGTRYMVAAESDAQDFKRRTILSTSDGGANTVKSQLHDHVQGNVSWPDVYDGRAVIHPSYRDQQDGVSLDENVKRFKAAKESGDISRMVTWSGTGVGLIKKEQPASHITEELRDSALEVIERMKKVI